MLIGNCFLTLSGEEAAGGGPEVKPIEGDDVDDGDKKKKRQTRGGKGVIKTKKKQAEPQRIGLSRASRGKKKFVTVVTGLATYGNLLFLSPTIVASLL